MQNKASSFSSLLLLVSLSFQHDVRVTWRGGKGWGGRLFSALRRDVEHGRRKFSRRISNHLKFCIKKKRGVCSLWKRHTYFCKDVYRVQRKVCDGFCLILLSKYWNMFTVIKHAYIFYANWAMFVLFTIKLCSELSPLNWHYLRVILSGLKSDREEEDSLGLTFHLLSVYWHLIGLH